ncbi:MAG TPA: ATP-binding protein [Terriglobales bacterium]|nr:ATP-binding protein [Terriglobales bacterium]
MIIVMAGLPGTGKSTLARALAPRIGATILNKDPIRAALFAPEDIEYSTSQDDFVMGILMQTAAYLVHRGPSRPIIIDGRPFSRRYQLEQVIRFAEQIGEPWRILECVCSDEAARVRLEKNSNQQAHPALNRNFDLYVGMKQRFEEITYPKTVIDTDNPLDACVRRAVLALTEG